MNTLFASVPLSFFSDLGQQFYDDFILKDRYQYIIRGLGNTVLLTLVAVVIGVVLGTVVALVRITHQNNPKKLRVLNGICGLYLTVIRGTPVVVQLMIMVYLILSSGETLLVAMLAFGINSGAYVAEVIRSGIQSVDHGQIEAGRSLGLSNRTTMIKIVFPQALKNVAPAIFNEFIALLKETSIAGYVGVQDLTKGGDIIRSITYDAFLPLFLIAGIYLVLVILLTSCLSGLERRLRKSDKR